MGTSNCLCVNCTKFDINSPSIIGESRNDPQQIIYHWIGNLLGCPNQLFRDFLIDFRRNGRYLGTDHYFLSGGGLPFSQKNCLQAVVG